MKFIAQGKRFICNLCGECLVKESLINPSFFFPHVIFRMYCMLLKVSFFITVYVSMIGNCQFPDMFISNSTYLPLYYS